MITPVEQLDELLTQALEQGASDLHCDPTPSHCRIRLRVDGVMVEHSTLPLPLYQAVLARVKTLSGLDIAQQRLPQDGRMTYFHNQIAAHFRTHTCACIHGEKLVLRLIQGIEQALQLDELGFLPEQSLFINTLLDQNHGLVVVCGPTGSGKTMTLYALLQALVKRNLQIITLEDPVEIELEGISQMQIHRKQDLDFANLLRASLRQDPDVIMIGEIRDEETAQIAVRAALTGHLVLTSLHTPNAAASLARLRNMGVAPYDLDECLHAVIAQRLVRRKQGLVFKGRTGVFECYQPNQQHLSLAQAGQHKIHLGLTTEEELRRVL